jgi:hypothetical protein
LSSDPVHPLHQMTSKPLIEVILEESWSSWLLLVITGMVWGSEEMWGNLMDIPDTTTFTAHDRDGKSCIWDCCSRNLNKEEIELRATHGDNISEPDAHDTKKNSLLHPPHKRCRSVWKYLSRFWYISIRVMAVYSIVFGILLVNKTSKNDPNGERDYGYVLFACTLVVQTLATIITTQLMAQRLNNPASLYCLPYFRGDIIPLCSFSFYLQFLQLLSADSPNIFS